MTFNLSDFMSGGDDVGNCPTCNEEPEEIGPCGTCGLVTGDCDGFGVWLRLPGNDQRDYFDEEYHAPVTFGSGLAAPGFDSCPGCIAAETKNP